MRIGSKERLATAALLAVIGLVAAAVWRTDTAVEDARHQRSEASEIARALTNLRLVTSEYALNVHERARVQWRAVSRRIDGLIAASRFSDGAEQEIFAGIRRRREQERQIFGELSSLSADGGADSMRAELNRKFEAQLLGRLFIFQQDNLTDAYRLNDLATARSDTALRRLLSVILSGLALIAVIKIAVSWLIHRAVLAPVARLQHAARQVAGGNVGLEFDSGGDDEIGQLTRDLGSMTRSLRNSLGQIERSNQELTALNTELEAFSYSVSHDLRSPLRSMDGFSLALLEDYGDKLDDQGRDFLKRIRAASQRMGRLIDDLLGLSHVTRTELRLQSVDLSEVAREIAASLQSDAPGRKVRWQIEDNLTMRADRALMRIAMQNLLGNAWKFTGKTPDAAIRVSRQEQNGRTVFFVADNGAGFDMAYADKLFEAFQRLHSGGEFPGTGIGLAIVQRVIRRHKGNLWAQALENEGATFFFTVGNLEEDSRGQDNPAG